MAAGSSTWDEAVARWSRVGGLGMEAALREIGCPENRISIALETCGLPLERFESRLLRRYFRKDTADTFPAPVIYSELEMCTVFATVRRGISSGGTIYIRDDVTENESTAFCVNLASNKKITELRLVSGDQRSGSWMDCTLWGNAFAKNPAITSLVVTVDPGSGCNNVTNGLHLIKTLESLRFPRTPLGDDGVKLVAESLGKGVSSLRSLDLENVGVGSEGVRSLLKSLQCIKTLEDLDLSNNPLGDEGVSLVAEFLANNTTLEVLTLRSVGCCLEGARQMSSALARNTCLQRLSFEILYKKNPWCNSIYQEAQERAYQCLKKKVTSGADLVEGYRAILEAFSLDMENILPCNSTPKNSTLRELILFLPDILRDKEPKYLESLIVAIKRNQSLHRLSLRGFELPPEIWKQHFFQALKENATLQTVDLRACKGLSGDVFPAVLDLLQNSNTALNDLDLTETELTYKMAQVHEELRINSEYRSALRAQSTVATTSGRLVLCGFGFGGKTEICKTMQQIDKGASFFHSLKMGWKRLIPFFPALGWLLYGKEGYLELMSRTRGCDILVLENQAPLKSIWDFAGQQEYYALHDYLFPDANNSCFVFVCSSRIAPNFKNSKGEIKDKETMRTECEYWMKFLASNSKVRIGKDGQQLPEVVFVLTKKDTLKPNELSHSTAIAKEVVKDLGVIFNGVLNLCETVEVVDSRSAKDVGLLLTVVKEALERTLKDKTEYAVCQAVRKVLGKWSAEHKLKPILDLEEYYCLCQDEMKEQNRLILVSESERQSRVGRDVVLAYLNDLGEIIYLKRLGFIVVNPKWFGVGVLGSLINAFKGKEDTTGLLTSCLPSSLDPPKHEGGFVDRETLKNLLGHSLKAVHLEQSLTTDHLTQLMIELEMCYNKNPDDRDSPLFTPALFDDPEDLAVRGQRQLYWNLHQGTRNLVYLGRRLACENQSKTFLTPGFFPRWQVHMLKWLQETGWSSNHAFEIGRNVIGFSNNGIEVLIEYSGDIDYFIDILVRSSQLYGDSLKFVETHVLQNICQFCASPQGCQGVVLATSVIRPVCVEYLDKCIDRKDHAVLISVLQSELSSNLAYKHTWKRRGEEVDTSNALDLLEGKGSFFSPKQKRTQDWKADVTSSSTPSSSRRDELPKLIYPTIDDVGNFRKIVTSLNLRKKIAIKLHLYCDNKDSPHKVAEQPGRTYILNWNAGGVDLPIAKHLVTLSYSAVGVGLTVAGARFALPSDDNLKQLFDAPQMPAIELQRLRQQMFGPAQDPKPESSESICALLKQYMEKDPRAMGLKKFLDLDNTDKFWDDFRVRKVVYCKEAPHQIGWVCDQHYWTGLNEGILESF